MRLRRPAQRPLVAALLACTLALVAFGCGGDDDDASPQSLLSTAATKEIDSAEMRLDAETDIPGFPILGSQIAISGSGPFVANGPEAVPEFDWRVTMRADDQAFPARVSGIDGQVYVEFMNQFYAADEEQLEEAGISAGEPRRQATSLKQLGLDPDEWLTRIRVSDGEEIGGDSTRLVTGAVVKRAVVENLLAIFDTDWLTQAGGDGDGGGFALEEENADEIAAAVDAAKVEVNVDDDGYPRRVFANLRFTVPDDVEDAAFERGEVTFELVLEQIGDVEVNVEPPIQPEPLSNLFDFARSVFSIDEPSDFWTAP